MAGNTHTNVEGQMVFPFFPVQGQTNKFIAQFLANWLSQDIHIDRITLNLETAPGSGTPITLTVTDGTNTMTVSVNSATVKSGASTTNGFDLDVSAEVLDIKYTMHASAAIGGAVAIITYHTIWVAA